MEYNEFIENIDEDDDEDETGFMCYKCIHYNMSTECCRNGSIECTFVRKEEN